MEGMEGGTSRRKVALINHRGVRKHCDLVSGFERTRFRALTCWALGILLCLVTVYIL